MTMSAHEDAIKRFLRKISPERDWQYIGEVEHLWMTELYDELVAEAKAENDRLRERIDAAHMSRLLTENENELLRELVRDAWGDGHPDISCGDCEIRDACHAEIEEAHKNGNGRWNTRCLFERRIEDRMHDLGIEVD